MSLPRLQILRPPPGFRVRVGGAQRRRSGWHRGERVEVGVGRRGWMAGCRWRLGTW